MNRPGLFFEPTILSNVSDDNFVATEESFGPIMVVSKFDDEFVLLSRLYFSIPHTEILAH